MAQLCFLPVCLTQIPLARTFCFLQNNFSLKTNWALLVVWWLLGSVNPTEDWQEGPPSHQAYCLYLLDLTVFFSLSPVLLQEAGGSSLRPEIALRRWAGIFCSQTCLHSSAAQGCQDWFFSPRTYEHFLLLPKTLGALSSPNLLSKVQRILIWGWAGNAILSRVIACGEYRDGKKACADSTFYPAWAVQHPHPHLGVTVGGRKCRKVVKKEKKKKKWRRLFWTKCILMF